MRQRTRENAFDEEYDDGDYVMEWCMVYLYVLLVYFLIQSLQLTKCRFEAAGAIYEVVKMRCDFLGCEYVRDGCCILSDGACEYVTFASVLWAVK